MITKERRVLACLLAPIKACIIKGKNILFRISSGAYAPYALWYIDIPLYIYIYLYIDYQYTL